VLLQDKSLGLLLKLWQMNSLSAAAYLAASGLIKRISVVKVLWMDVLINTPDQLVAVTCRNVV